MGHGHPLLPFSPFHLSIQLCASTCPLYLPPKTLCLHTLFVLPMWFAFGKRYLSLLVRHPEPLVLHYYYCKTPSSILFAIVQTTLGFSVHKESAHSARDLGLTPGSGRSPGEGSGYPLQYSCLGYPMDRGAWRAAVHRVAQSWT